MYRSSPAPDVGWWVATPPPPPHPLSHPSTLLDTQALPLRQRDVLAQLFALQGEQDGPDTLPPAITPTTPTTTPTTTTITTAAAVGTGKQWCPPLGVQSGEALEERDDKQEEQHMDEREAASERVQEAIYAWLDHHLALEDPERAQECGIALTDLLDGLGWCLETDCEVDQVFDTLAEMERRCAGLKEQTESVNEQLKCTIRKQLQVAPNEDSAAGFGSRLLALHQELELPLPNELHELEQRRKLEQAGRQLLERMHARVNSSRGVVHEEDKEKRPPTAPQERRRKEETPSQECLVS